MVVASRVLTARHHHLIAFYFLGLVGDDVPLALLRHHVADVTFLRLYVIGNLVGLVAVFAIFENGLAFPFVLQTIVHSPRINEA